MDIYQCHIVLPQNIITNSDICKLTLGKDNDRNERLNKIVTDPNAKPIKNSNYIENLQFLSNKNKVRTTFRINEYSNDKGPN